MHNCSKHQRSAALKTWSKPSQCRTVRYRIHDLRYVCDANLAKEDNSKRGLTPRRDHGQPSCIITASRVYKANHGRGAMRRRGRLLDSAANLNGPKSLVPPSTSSSISSSTAPPPTRSHRHSIYSFNPGVTHVEYFPGMFLANFMNQCMRRRSTGTRDHGAPRETLPQLECIIILIYIHILKLKALMYMPV